MKKYIGAKIIKARLANLAEYKKAKFTNPIINEDDKDVLGYIVLYPGIGENEESYISWSPKEVFETAYREIHPKEEEFIKGGN